MEVRRGLSLWELPIFAIIGACGGISGALLVIVQSKVGLFRAKYIPYRESLPFPPFPARNNHVYAI